MKPLLSIIILCLALSARAQTADSVRTELTTEPTTAIQSADTSERATTEQKKLKQLFRSSCKETTMFQLGIASPDQFGFIGNRTLQNRYGYGGFWAGVNHKLTPSIGLRVGACGVRGASQVQVNTRRPETIGWEWPQ